MLARLDMRRLRFPCNGASSIGTLAGWRVIKKAVVIQIAIGLFLSIFVLTTVVFAVKPSLASS